MRWTRERGRGRAAAVKFYRAYRDAPARSARSPCRQDRLQSTTSQVPFLPNPSWALAYNVCIHAICHEPYDAVNYRASELTAGGLSRPTNHIKTSLHGIGEHERKESPDIYYMARARARIVQAVAFRGVAPFLRYYYDGVRLLSFFLYCLLMLWEWTIHKEG